MDLFVFSYDVIYFLVQSKTKKDKKTVLVVLQKVSIVCTIKA